MKNLLSIIILALLVVNIVLSAIMMISVTSASKKTAALVSDISTIGHWRLNGLPKSETAWFRIHGKQQKYITYLMNSRYHLKIT